jgi:putative transposase
MVEKRVGIQRGEKKLNRSVYTILYSCYNLSFYVFFSNYSYFAMVMIVAAFYVSINFKDKEPNLNIINNVIDIDLNTTGHVAVVSNPQTGKVWES